MFSILPTGFRKYVASVSAFARFSASQVVLKYRRCSLSLTSIIEDQISALKLIAIPADILPIVKENSSLYKFYCSFERKRERTNVCMKYSVWYFCTDVLF